MAHPRWRLLLVRALALLIALVLFLASGEAMLRLIYRDGGRTTLGAPGGESFDHLTIGQYDRGRRDTGKKINIPRIMVIGDSITYGLGVRDWRLAWPERLASKLEAESRPHEMAVFATPEDGIAEHVKTLDREGPRVQPDVLFYQWFVNDIEIFSPRPYTTRAWQRWSGHDLLRRLSYLYFFVDNRAGALLPPPGRSYVQYLVQDFTPGSLEWAEFERYFHNFAIRASTLAPRRIVLLYPIVPYRGEHPLKAIHDRMKAMATPHTMVIPAAAWLRFAATMEGDPMVPSLQQLRIAGTVSGRVAETRDFFFLPGIVDVGVELAVEDRGAREPHVATLEVVDMASQQPIASAPIRARLGVGGSQRVVVPLAIPGPRGRRVRYRIVSAGHGAWALAELAIPVDYGLQVVDLSEALNTFNTHVSLFDSHPNARAQQVIANVAFDALNAGAHGR